MLHAHSMVNVMGEMLCNAVVGSIKYFDRFKSHNALAFEHFNSNLSNTKDP